MYSLVGKVAGGPQELKGKMCDYVKKRGRVIVVNPEKDKTMVQELLDFKEKLDLVMVTCFGSNEQFIGQAHHMFSRFVKLRIYNLFHKIFFVLFFYWDKNPDITVYHKRKRHIASHLKNGT